VNLGFSGNGLGEPALAEAIGELNPSNSLGFYFNADGLEPSLRTVLAEVKGESGTN
jgi:hypothetical protein